MSHLEKFDNWFKKLWTDTLYTESRDENPIVEREADIVASIYHHARSTESDWRVRCQAKAYDPTKENPKKIDPGVDVVCRRPYNDWRDKASSRRIDLEVTLPDGTLIPIEVKTFWQRGMKGMKKDLENLWFRLENPFVKPKVVACYYCMVGYGGLSHPERYPEGKVHAQKILEWAEEPEYEWMRGVLRAAYGSAMKHHSWGFFKV